MASKRQIAADKKVAQGRARLRIEMIRQLLFHISTLLGESEEVQVRINSLESELADLEAAVNK